MTHLGFVTSAYALGVLVPAWLALGAARRLQSARKRLAALDKRVAR